jgi:hypothetical protein
LRDDSFSAGIYERVPTPVVLFVLFLLKNKNNSIIITLKKSKESIDPSKPKLPPFKMLLSFIVVSRIE